MIAPGFCHGAIFADFAAPCSLNVRFRKLGRQPVFHCNRNAFDQLPQPAERIFPALNLAAKPLRLDDHYTLAADTAVL